MVFIIEKGEIEEVSFTRAIGNTGVKYLSLKGGGLAKSDLFNEWLKSKKIKGNGGFFPYYWSDARDILREVESEPIMKKLEGVEGGKATAEVFHACLGIETPIESSKIVQIVRLESQKYLARRIDISLDLPIYEGYNRYQGIGLEPGIGIYILTKECKLSEMGFIINWYPFTKDLINGIPLKKIREKYNKNA